MKQLAEFFKAPETGAQQMLGLRTSAEPVALPPVGTREAFVGAPGEAAAASGPMTPPAGWERATHVEREATDVQREAKEERSFVTSDDASRPVEVPPGGPFAEAPAATPALAALQLHNTYLVVETPEGMQIIDQHALHERILFEELFTRVTRGPLESQRLLIPLTLSASPRQVDLVEQIRPLLDRLGIEISAFGPRQIAVTGFPSFLSRLDPVEFVEGLLERGEQEILDLSEEELLHDVLDMMACKAAVKAGDPLTPTQIAGLLARRHLTERASNCPHGRPTTLKMSLRDLEKQFKRTGF